ncbi:MAG: DUF4199 family protein [Saprospiraceae bacterium]|nr:DUF4199 family protein [Saprospiraceae bacterium]
MKRIAVRYGLWMFAGFSALFLAMHLVGLSTNPNLRVLNGIVHITLIYFAIRDFRRYSPAEFNYLSGVAVGMYASMIGVTCFALFQILFLELNPDFLATLQSTLTVGHYLNSFTASSIIFLEGIGISLIASYVVTRVIDMQLALPYTN